MSSSRTSGSRFGLAETELTVDPEAPYVNAAREVFADCPETAVFCYGHTHRPSMREVEDRLLVNTGTWLKRLHRRDVIAGQLPPVFYRSYQLCVVRIEADGEGVAIEFEAIEKSSPSADVARVTRIVRSQPVQSIKRVQEPGKDSTPFAHRCQ